MLRPDSYSLGVASKTHIDYVLELENHFQNNSNHFDVPTTTGPTDGSSGHGFVLDPQDSNIDWQVAINYSSANSDIRGYIDPDGNITDPLNHGGASSQASGIVQLVQTDLTSEVSIILISETKNTVNFVIPAEPGIRTRYHAFLGKVYTPAWGDDWSFGMDGLGIQKGTPGIGFHFGQYRIGEETWVDGNADEDIIGSFPSGLTRIKRLKVLDHNENQDIGDLRVLYRFKNQFDDTPTRIEDRLQLGGGFAFNAGEHVIPWDPDVKALPP